MRGGIGVAAAALLLGGCAMVRTPYVAVDEHELQPAEGAPRPAARTQPDFKVVDPGLELGAEPARAAVPIDDVSVWEEFPQPVWDWPRKHLKASARFPDMFLGPEIYPEVSVGTLNYAAHVDRGDRVEFSSLVDLSLYWLNLRFPVVDTLDGTRPEPRLQLNFKVPFAIPGSDSNWLAVLWGATLSDSNPQIADSSRFQLLYGYGGELFSAQLRVGYGYSETFASSALRQGLLYGALLGLNLGKVQPIVEVDGIRFVGRDDQLSLMPGVRFLPGELPTLQLGLSGLVVLTRGDNAPSQRYGAIFEASYNFL